MQKGVLISGLAVAVVLGACNPSPTPPPPSGPGTTTAPVATIKLPGKIVFEGTPPSEKGASGKSGILHSAVDPKCPQGVKKEDVVVSDGGLENVIVYISSGAEGK